MFKASLFAILILSLSLRSAFACSCFPPKTPLEEMERANAVFSGKVTKISQPENVQATFEVAETWKGIHSQTITVVTAANSAACGYSFKEGQSYLVYAYGRDKLSTNICSRTTRLENAQEDLAGLGEGQIALSIASQRRSTKIAWITFALLTSATITWQLIRFKRRSH